MNLKAEFLSFLITIGTTFIFSDFFVELLIGIAVYSCSRIFYNQYGKWMNDKYLLFATKFKKFLKK